MSPTLPPTLAARVLFALTMIAVAAMSATGLWLLRAYPWFGPVGDPWPVVSGWIPSAPPGDWHGTTRVLHLAGGVVLIVLSIAHAIAARRSSRLKSPSTIALGFVSLAVITGVVLWRPVQLQEITTALGGFDAVRLIHFLVVLALAGLGILVLIARVRSR